MPEGPWQTVNMDFFGPLPSGKYLLVLIDSHSRFLRVRIFSSTAASSMIPKFATHGLPLKVKSNNTLPFKGDDLAKYMLTLGINFKPYIHTQMASSQEIHAASRKMHSK